MPLNGGTPLQASNYLDTTAVNGTQYHYVVTAVDTSDNESAASSEVVATPNVQDSIAPGAPDGPGGDRGRRAGLA